MKKIALFILLGISLHASAQWPYFQQNHSSTTAGITYDYPVDIHFDGVNKVYSYFTANNGGTIVAKYNSGTGAIVDVVYLSKSGLPFSPVRVRTQGTDYYALFNIVVSGFNRFCLVKLNAATNAVVFVKQINNLSGNIDLAGVDFVHDGTANVYVLSNTYNAGNNQTDLAVTKIDVSTATPVVLWNYTYENTTREEFGSNIIVQGTNLFVSAISVDQASILDRGPVLLKLDLNGNYVASRLYKYGSNCASARSAGTWVMPGKALTLSSISYVGADGNGPLWLARIDPLTLNVTLQAHYSSGTAYMNPEIQVVRSTAGNKVLMSGSAHFVNTATPGYVHCYFDLATLAFTSGVYYGTTNPSPWAGQIFDTYINTGIGMNVFTVAQNEGFPNDYHLLKTSDLGDNACDLPYAISPSSCVFDYYQIPFVQRDNAAILSNIKLFSVAPVSDSLIESCYVTCPGCELAPNPNQSSMTTKSGSISEIGEGINAYPNPTTGLVKLEFNTETVTEIKVFNLIGVAVKASAQPTNFGATLDFGNELPGIYLIHYTLNGEVKILRIVKE